MSWMCALMCPQHWESNSISPISPPRTLPSVLVDFTIQSGKFLNQRTLAGMVPEVLVGRDSESVVDFFTAVALSSPISSNVRPPVWQSVKASFAALRVVRITRAIPLNGDSVQSSVWAESAERAGRFE